MKIRRAQEKDMERIHMLLDQVALVHHRGRPDLFKYGTRKYTDEELKKLIHNDSRPIFNRYTYRLCTGIRLLYLSAVCGS